MKHRKLLPAENSTYTTQHADCGFCSPVCPHPTCIPTVVIFTPPLPSLPSPPPPPPPHHHVSAYVIIFVCLAVGFFLFIMFNVVTGKVREVNQGNTRRAEEEELVDENRVVHHHPIWLISTVGLQPSVIDSISVCKYKKGEGLIEGTECSVCLNEFQQDETLRILPKCSHAFHISCIDPWLKSHTNCPLCRAYIVPSSATAPLPLIDQNSASSTVIVNSQIENSEPDRQLSENRERNGQAREIRAGTEERDLQPLRRSVSFDSSSLAETVTLELDDFPDESEDDGENSHSEIVKNQDGEKPSTSREMGNCSSIVQCLHKSPASMKRSVSCSGRILSPRLNKNQKTILPH